MSEKIPKRPSAQELLAFFGKGSNSVALSRAEALLAKPSSEASRCEDLGFAPQSSILKTLVVGADDYCWRKTCLEESKRSPQIIKDWRAAFEEMLNLPQVSVEIKTAFHREWMTTGHLSRQLVCDDKLIAKALRAWLPNYSGPDMELYRGESFERFEKKEIGFGWTPEVSVAQLFARGPNSCHPGGGAVLKYLIPTAAIISGPFVGDHGEQIKSEKEFIVDREMLDYVDIEIVSRFPQKEG